MLDKPMCFVERHKFNFKKQYPTNIITNQSKHGYQLQIGYNCRIPINSQQKKNKNKNHTMTLVHMEREQSF